MRPRTFTVSFAWSSWLCSENELRTIINGNVVLAPATMSSSFVLLSSCSTYASTSKSRLQSLYSDISRQKHSNPTSYHAYVDWWQRTLEELVSRGWQTESAIPQKSKREDTQDADTETQSNKLVFGARRAIVDRLRYDGVGKPLGLASTIVRALSFPHFN